MAITHVTNGENLIMTLWYSLFIGVVENAILAQMKENNGILSLPHVKQLIIGWKLSFDVMIQFKLDLACICMYKSTDCLMRFSEIDRNHRLLWVCKLDNILKIFHFEIISENEGNFFLYWNCCPYKCCKVCIMFLCFLITDFKM